MRKRSENGGSSRSEAEEGRTGAEEKSAENAEREQWIESMLQQFWRLQGVRSDFDFPHAWDLCMGFLRGLRVMYGKETTGSLQPFIEDMREKDPRVLEAVLYGVNLHRVRKAEREGRL